MSGENQSNTDNRDLKRYVKNQSDTDNKDL